MSTGAGSTAAEVEELAPANAKAGEWCRVAVVRGLALKLNAGMGRCWVDELAWEEDGRLSDTGRVVAWCDQAPINNVHGSGVCAGHAVLFAATEGGWSNN